MAESSIDQTLVELNAYLTKINDGLAGFQFLVDGNDGQAALQPLQDTVVLYEDQKRLTEEAIAALTDLQAGGYPNLPQMSTTQEIASDIDNDLRQAGFAKEQITVAAAPTPVRRFVSAS